MISAKPVSFHKACAIQIEAEIVIVHKFRGVSSPTEGVYRGVLVVSGELHACSTASFFELVLTGVLAFIVQLICTPFFHSCMADIF